MKSIQIIILIVLSILLLFASSQIDRTVHVFSTVNMNCLFVILMCGILFYTTTILTNKMIKVDKKLYPKSLLIWLLISFGLICCILFSIAAYSNDRALFDIGLYIVFFSNVFICIGCIMEIRHKIRENTTDKKSHIC